MSETKTVAVISENPVPLQSIEIREEAVDHDVTGVASARMVDGVVELAVPNLLPTDNAAEIYEVPVHRLKIPVRIQKVEVETVNNGFKVKLQNAGRQGMFGPDGAEHVFAGANSKTEMLEFVALVIGQVSYQYREVESETYNRIVKKQQAAAHSMTAVDAAEAAEDGYGPMLDNQEEACDAPEVGLL